METTIQYIGVVYIGIMEKNIEITIWGLIRVEGAGRGGGHCGSGGGY